MWITHNTNISTHLTNNTITPPFWNVSIQAALLFVCFIFSSLSIAAAPVSKEMSKETSEVSGGVSSRTSSFEDDFSSDIDSGDFDDEWDDDSEAEINDPIEPFNRAMFWFNDKVYFYLLKPIARASRTVPQPIRRSVDHFFTNLEHPIYAVNAALQLKFKTSGILLSRFAINSTVGVLGLFDPAQSAFKLSYQVEDFGQTLGHYGVKSGMYIVVPLLGSTNVRDLVGRMGDLYVTPSRRILNDTRKELIYRASDTMNEFSLDKNTYELVKATALDPYLFVRDAYQQQRNSLITQ